MLLECEEAEVTAQLLAPAEFNPTPAPRCEPDALRPVPVLSPRRGDSGSRWHLPGVLGRPLAIAVDTSAALVALPGRVIELVTVAEQALTALCAVVVRTNALLERAEGITGTAEDVLRAADRTVTAAAGTVEQAHAAADRAIALLGAYSDALNRLAPMVSRLADTHASDVDALVQLMGRLPQLADAMDHQVIPLLGHLEEVVPDMNQLLDQACQLSHMASRLPKVFRRPNPQPA
jgi:ABC-type transporter Mla subunit MlaD